MNHKYEWLLKQNKIQGIYCIRNKYDNRTYIGKSTDIGSRWHSHLNLLNSGKHHTVSLQEAWLSYGFSAFEFSIVEIVPKESEPSLLSDREIYWWGLQPNPYNGKPHANKFAGPTKETKQKISKSLKGKPKSEDHKSKAGKTKIGNKYREGKSNSDNQKQKASETMKGKPKSEEQKQKMSEARKKYWETKQKSKNPL